MAGLGLLLDGGLAGIVSSVRGPVGEDERSTVLRLSGSTADVSHVSNPSSVERGWASWGRARSGEEGQCNEGRLADNRRVLEVMGRTALESDDRSELKVCVGERGPPDPGDEGVRVRLLRPLAHIRVVRLSGSDLVRGADLSASSGWEHTSGLGPDVLPAMEWKTKKTSCVANARPEATAAPARNPPTLQPRMVLAGSWATRLRQTILATERAAVTVQKIKLTPNQRLLFLANGIRALEGPGVR